MARYKVIANPTAGGGAGARAIPQIERLLAKHGLDFDVVCTERPWHAAETAREAVAAGYDVVVAAGGRRARIRLSLPAPVEVEKVGWRALCICASVDVRL